ncbi:MAG: AraC family transcriptional regulator, partial [Anaerolineae bacterium]|nr:AraC family transcriptional regulator [Anaerolineae bacterium]
MRDVLTDVLNTVRLHSCIYCQSEINKSNWALRFSATSCSVFHIVAEGTCLAEVEGSATPICLSAGDLLVLPGGYNHMIADRPGAALCADIHLEQETDAECMLMRWGDNGPRTTLVCGTFAVDRDNGGDLLRLLPPILTFDAQSVTRYGIKPSIDALIEEARAVHPGRETILTRLADVLFVKVVRAWLASPDNQTIGWLRALNDPHLSAAVSQIHAAPDQDWTVESLAGEAYMSRSAFAARFAEIIGETP